METFNMMPDTGGVPKKFNANNGSYLERLSEEAVDMAIEFLAKAPGPGAVMLLIHYMHGAICRVPTHSTAFRLRKPGAFHVAIAGGWDDPAEAQAWTAWTDEVWQAFQQYSSGRSYANFPGPEGGLPREAAYGENYSRLVEVKKRYDPSNVFRLNQNILPSSG